MKYFNFSFATLGLLGGLNVVRCMIDNCSNQPTPTSPCYECDAGYIGINGNMKCVEERECDCNNGIPQEWMCTTPGENRCMECDAGYVLDGSYNCVEEPEPLNNCATQVGNSCMECEAGYLQLYVASVGNTQCVEEQECSCNNGMPQEWMCTTSGENRCLECDAGYELHGANCVEEPQELDNCTNQVGNLCQECDAGYIAVNGNTQCNPEQQCFCSNGVPQDWTCAEIGENKCATCDMGFHLDNNNNNCVPSYECVCDNGQPANSKQCSAEGAHECRKCDMGFHLEGKRCIETHSEGYAPNPNGYLDLLTDEKRICAHQIKKANVCGLFLSCVGATKGKINLLCPQSCANILNTYPRTLCHEDYFLFHLRATWFRLIEEPDNNQVCYKQGGHRNKRHPERCYPVNSFIDI